jgi:hypothetical protein
MPELISGWVLWWFFSLKGRPRAVIRKPPVFRAPGWIGHPSCLAFLVSRILRQND